MQIPANTATLTDQCLLFRHVIFVQRVKTDLPCWQILCPYRTQPHLYLAPLPLFSLTINCCFFPFLSISSIFPLSHFFLALFSGKRKMKEIRKWPESEGLVEIVGKRPRTPTIFEAEEENEEELLLAGFFVEEETLMQLMKVLEDEISCPANAHNRWSSMMYSPSSSFVTINSNEESCGPSFSDSASTVMASIDMGGISISYFMNPTNASGPLLFPYAVQEEQGSLEIGDVSVSAVPGEGKGINSGGNEFEVEESDDEWLARVLSGAPIEFEE